MKWRRFLILLHRDVGFLMVGLTVVYAVSGIAVNHREHWDYNYSRSRQQRHVGTPAQLLVGRTTATLSPLELQPGRLARAEQASLVQALTLAVGREAPPRTVFWRGPDRLSLFFGEADQDVVDYLPSRGLLVHAVNAPRPLIRQANFLHLNEGRGWWTFAADLYAVLLLFLAISGAVVVKGRRGLRGRGGVLLAIGAALPVLAYWLIR